MFYTEESGMYFFFFLLLDLRNSITGGNNRFVQIQLNRLAVGLGSQQLVEKLLNYN